MDDDEEEEPSPMIVAHVSYLYLTFTAAIHVLTAAMIAGIFAEAAKVKSIYLFVPSYLALMSLSAYLMLRNGRWAVDDRFIYKGWRLTPYISVSEIEHAQIGLPDNWISALARIPGTKMRALQADQKIALVLKLRGERWLVWQFWGMTNRDGFVRAVLRLSPNQGRAAASLVVPTSIPLFKVGRIFQG